ncbi:phage late control D family protein [Alcaligenaceae bacterium SJ-26]|nr:phage late control D family protein [Alcaligenaceae bacterium SJ-26]
MIDQSSIYPRAIWRATLNGQDLTARLNPRLMSLSLSENRGDEVDQLDIELTDHDGLLELPPLGAELRLFLGWSDTGLIDKGSFRIDEITHAGTPDVITLMGRSADMSGPLRTRTERSFHDRSIAQVIEEIAAANNLKTSVDKQIGKIKIPHIDQTNESDAAFLKRIGDRYDAVATIKDGNLLFLPITGSRTASGQEIPVIQLQRKDGDQHSYHQASRDSYTGVKAKWTDIKTGHSKNVLVGVTGNTKTLRYSFANEADALAEAQAEWQRIRRGEETMSYALAYGRPDLGVQVKVQIRGLKSAIDGHKWLIKKISHRLDGDGGMVTLLELESEKSESLDV